MQKLSKNQQNEIVKKLIAKEVLILPTDTIYGLSSIVKNNSPEVLNKLKKANLEKPVIVLVRNIKSILHLIEYEKADLKLLKAKKPTTVIFKLKNSSGTLAIRLCKRRDLKNILKKTGPIYSTSVNLTSNTPLKTYEELTNFLKVPENIYWVGVLNSQPSKIYNAITKKWVR